MGKKNEKEKKKEEGKENMLSKYKENPSLTRHIVEMPRKWHEESPITGLGNRRTTGVIRSKQMHTRLERDATDLRWAGLQATTL